MIISLTHARPSELPGILAHIIANPASASFDVKNYLTADGKVGMLLDGVMYYVAPPATPVSSAPAVLASV